MSNLRQAAYHIDPALWVGEVLGVGPTACREFLCARIAAPRSSP